MSQEAWFDFNPTPDPDKWSFWVRVHINDFETAKMPVARTTTFANFLLKVEGASQLEGYGAYYYVEAASAATPGYFRFYFAASSTSTSLIGKSYSSDQALPPAQFLESSTIQTTSQVVPYGTSPTSSSDVVTSSVEPINGIISRINTNAVLSYDQTPLYSWVFDSDTGKGYQVKEELVAAGTVGSTEVAADGTFAAVSPVNAAWSIKTTKKVTTMDSTPVTDTKTERSPVYWPAALLSHKFVMVLDASALADWQKKLFYSM